VCTRGSAYARGVFNCLTYKNPFFRLSYADKTGMVQLSLLYMHIKLYEKLHAEFLLTVLFYTVYFMNQQVKQSKSLLFIQLMHN
jgi:hypothetical protein